MATSVRTVNEGSLQILLALNTFAYLRVRDLQAYLRLSSDASLRRTLLSLESDGYISHTLDHRRYQVFALSVKGSNVLKREGYSDARATTRFLNAGNYEHRTLANEIAIYHSQGDYNKIWTEHQIQAGGTPVVYGFNKVPDYLIHTEGMGYTWGEVERTKKSKHDFSHLLRWISLMFRCPEGELPQLTADGYLCRVEFACSPSFEHRLIEVVGEDFADNWFSFRSLEISHWS